MAYCSRIPTSEDTAFNALNGVWWKKSPNVAFYSSNLRKRQLNLNYDLIHLIPKWLPF